MRYTLITLILIGILGCGAPQESSTEEEQWSYTGETGPENWDELSAGCDGMFQSPIDIDTSNIRMDTAMLEESVVHAGALTHVNSVTNNGHTIRYDFE